MRRHIGGVCGKPLELARRWRGMAALRWRLLALVVIHGFNGLRYVLTDYTMSQSLAAPCIGLFVRDCCGDLAGAWRGRFEYRLIARQSTSQLKRLENLLPNIVGARRCPYVTWSSGDLFARDTLVKTSLSPDVVEEYMKVHQFDAVSSARAARV
jgi:hypothetical protein